MTQTTPSCCHPSGDDHSRIAGFDYILWGSVGIISLVLAMHFSGFNSPTLQRFSDTIVEFLGTMWWGVALGIVVVGLMNKLPREYFQAILGKGDSLSGLLRACLAGLLLDMCSHGILMVGAKLYERGASLAQVMTFLIASPWNSFSLTLVLIALIGWQWTIVFIAGSMAIAIATGCVYIVLTRNGTLAENRNKLEDISHFSLRKDALQRLSNFKPTTRFFIELATGGLHEARILLRWLLLGIIIAATVRTFIPAEVFTTFFGPTLLGPFVTLGAAAIIEVCSEGSTPIASEIFKNAAAPGNAFAFLMAGVSTDYTEIMVMKNVTQSWRIALSLPLITVPQILLLGHIMNVASIH